MKQWGGGGRGERGGGGTGGNETLGSSCLSVVGDTTLSRIFGYDELTVYQQVMYLEVIYHKRGRLFHPMGPLQLTVTWYKIRHVGTQATHWDIQNKAISSSQF